MTLKSKKGYILPYLLFLLFIILNIFTFVVLCRLNEKKLYEDKANYYQVIILVNRAKSHVIDRISTNSVDDYDTELLYYDDDFIYYLYTIDEVKNLWRVTIKISHNNRETNLDIYYSLDNNQIEIEYR